MILRPRKMLSPRQQMASGSHILMVSLLTANAFAWFIMMQRSFPPCRPVPSVVETLNRQSWNLICWWSHYNGAAWLTRSAQTFCFLWASLSWSAEWESPGFCELSIILSSSLCSTVFPNAQILHYLRYIPPPFFSLSLSSIYGIGGYWLSLGKEEEEN